jgi:hypothetical protein
MIRTAFFIAAHSVIQFALRYGIGVHAKPDRQWGSSPGETVKPVSIGERVIVLCTAAYEFYVSV